MSSKGHQWLIFAIASGACAAINGTFAKLTTTSLTSSLATSISSTLSLPESARTAFEALLRASFFGMNLLFDGLMWGLFTRALTLASSTVHVSVLNTGTNFLVAACAGWAVFGEKLPGMWWVGAALMVAGCLVIGGREGGADAIKAAGHGASEAEAVGEPAADGGAIRLGDEMRSGTARERSPYRDDDPDAPLR